MKKRTTAVIFVAVLACLTCAAAAGCEVTIHSPNIYSYKNADSYSALAFGEEKTLSKTEEITSLDFEWVIGEVKVSTDDEATGIRFYEKVEKSPLSDEAVKTDKIGEEYSLRYAVIDKVLCVRFAKNNVDLAQSPFAKNVCTKTLFVILPKKQFEKTKITAISASVTMDGITAEEIKTAAISGKITVTDCAANEMSLGTISGGVSVSGCAVKDALECDTTSGAVTVNDSSANELTLDTTSGEIKATNTDCKKAVLKSTSGQIALSLPKTATGFSVDFDTTSGVFYPSTDVKRVGNSYVYGDGSVKITAKTTSSNFTLSVG